MTTVLIPNKRNIPFFIDEEDACAVLALRWTPTGKCGRQLVNMSLYRQDRNISRLHRFILRPEVGEIVDHINGNPLDNRRANLRVCQLAENNRNKRKSGNITRRFKGVYRISGASQRNPWRAQIMQSGCLRHLGVFPTDVDAAVAYDQAARELHGEFAAVNFPVGSERSAIGDAVLHIGGI